MSDSEEDMIEAFFDFSKPLKRFPLPKCLNIVPKQVPKKVTQSAGRSHEGKEYASSHIESLSVNLSRQFSSMSLSALNTSVSASANASVSNVDNITNYVDQSTSFQSSMNSSFHANHRQDLPIFQSRDDIIEKIIRNPVVIISGQTGCGKSTQVPQYILDDSKARNIKHCQILISQPRKIAAITVATQVAQERNSPLGKEIGYQIGLRKEADKYETKTSILYCTTGVILQRLIGEKSMNAYSHIVIDEAHERDIDIDFLLIVVRRMLAFNSRNTKIILMSATMDTEKFASFFQVPLYDDDGVYVEDYVPPIIDLSVSPRTYQIHEFYLREFAGVKAECSNADLINYAEPCIKDGMYEFAKEVLKMCLNQQIKQRKNVMLGQTILVFLPGLYEIERFHEVLGSKSVQQAFEKLAVKPDICILHSKLSAHEQRNAFKTGSNVKIILATNIAESSVTIPNVTHVIDFCLTKYQTTAKGAQISSLILDWTSKNNCKQRAGRTGRVCDGSVIRMVDKRFFNNDMKEFPAPEMTRIALETVVIRTKELAMGKPLELLALALDPPDKSSVVDSVLRLKELGALLRVNENGEFDYEDGRLTFLGHVMGALPLDVCLSRLIIIGYVFSVFEEAIIIGAGLSMKRIFTQNYGNRIDSYINKMNFANGSQSDCIAILNAYNLWVKHRSEGLFTDSTNERSWCERYNLDVKNLYEMDLLVKEIKSRLERLNVQQLEYDRQPTWHERDKMLVLKVCIAGAFGPANFFLPAENSESGERDAARSINEKDLFNTVYFRNMNRRLVGAVYEEQLRNFLMQKRVIDEWTNMKVTFDTFKTEKIFISFEVDNSRMDNSRDKFPLGKIPSEVYKAVKHRKSNGNVPLMVMTEEETLKYAEHVGLGKFEGDSFKLTVNTIKRPDLCVLPTINTKNMHGSITHVINPNKFFFRPKRSSNFEKSSSRCGERVEKFNFSYTSNIIDLTELMDKAFVVTISTVTIVPDGLFVLCDYKKVRERGEFVRRTGDSFEIYLIDHGYVAEDVNPDLTYIIIQSEIEKKIMAYPPQVFECTLTDIRPSMVKQAHGLWTSEAVDWFRSKVRSESAEIDIFSVVDDIVSVTLYVNDVNMNMTLVKQNYAEECEESYVSKANHAFRRDKFHPDQMTAEEEFKNKIDKRVKTKIVDSPSMDICTNKLNLIGPFSPLEAEVHGVSRIVQLKADIDPTSVNSVLLNDDILSFRGKFCVAADVTVSPSGRKFSIRETTIMPNIPGLAIILATIFSPTVEIRRDDQKSRYLSILAGLGFDKDREQPLYGERDSVLDIDCDFSEADFETINNLRYAISRLLSQIPGSATVDLSRSEKEKTLRSIQQFFLSLMNAQNRPVLEVRRPADAFEWNVDQPEKTATIWNGPYWIFEPINIPKIQPLPVSVELKRHAAELKMCAEGHFIIHTKVCRFCNYTWDHFLDLKIHLLTLKHRSRCLQMKIDP